MARTHPYDLAGLREAGSAVFGRAQYRIRERRGSQIPENNIADLRLILETVGRALHAETVRLEVPPLYGSAASRVRKSVPHWIVLTWKDDDSSEGPRSVPDLETRDVAAVAQPPSGDPIDRPRAVVDDEGRAHLRMPLSDEEGNLYGILEAHLARGESDFGGITCMSVIQRLLVGFLQKTRSTNAVRQSDRAWKAFVEACPSPVLIAIDGHIVHLNRRIASLLGDPHPDFFVGRRITEFVSPKDLEALAGNLEALIRADLRTSIEFTLVGIDGRMRYVEAACTPVVCRGMPASEIALQDVSSYKKSLARYASLIDTASDALWQVELREPVDISDPTDVQIRRIFRDGILTNCNGMLARLFNLDSTEHLIGKSVGALLGRVSGDLLKHFIESGYRLNNVEHWFRSRERTLVHLVNASGIFEQGQLTRISGSCAEATHRLDKERQVLRAQDVQLERIGRDLHDSVGPLLTGVRLLSDAVVTHTALESEQIRTKFKKIAEFADEANRQLRNIYLGVMPRTFDQTSLIEALDQLGAAMDYLTPTRVQLHAEPSAEVHDVDEKTHLFHIVQEAVNNAIKHAGATQIDISLVRRTGKIVLDVRDDGKGFDLNSVRSTSYGLDNMRQRAHAVGAALEISSIVGGGTVVRCALPHRVHLVTDLSREDQSHRR